MATLPTGNGFKLEDGTDILPPDAPQVGWSVSNIGDINQDSFDDYVIGAPSTLDDFGGPSAGRVYVVFGSSTPLTSPVDLTNLGSGGFIIDGLSGDDLGAHVGDQLGWSVSAAGDVNNDGIADLVVGAPRVPSAAGVLSSTPDEAGQAFVIFGSADPFTNIDLGTPSSAFISITGIAESRAGLVVADAGDVNGDLIADFIVGAPGQIRMLAIPMSSTAARRSPISISRRSRPPTASSFTAMPAGRRPTSPGRLRPATATSTATTMPT